MCAGRRAYFNQVLHHSEDAKYAEKDKKTQIQRPRGPFAGSMALKPAQGEQQPSSSHVMSLSRSGNGLILSKRGSSPSGGLARWRQSKQAAAAAAAHLAMGGGKWRTGEGLHQPAASQPAKLNLINLLQPRFGPQLARLTFVILPPTSCTPSAAAPDPRVPRQRLILSSRIPPSPSSAAAFRTTSTPWPAP